MTLLPLVLRRRTSLTGSRRLSRMFQRRLGMFSIRPKNVIPSFRRLSREVEEGVYSARSLIGVRF